MLGAESERLILQAQIHYKVERTGVFELKMSFPEPWEMKSVGPEQVVDDHELKGQGASRELYVLLKKEQTGDFDIEILAQAEREDAEAKVDFELPLARVAAASGHAAERNENHTCDGRAVAGDGIRVSCNRPVEACWRRVQDRG
jgi:hypothetical protein